MNSSPLERFFDRIFVINLARRPDRWIHFQNEMECIGVSKYERFDAVDLGPDWGNHACTASHRAVLDIICRADKPGKFLIFEDDATVRAQFRTSFNEEVMPPIREVPSEFDMLYLSGHYAEDPRGWFSKHLILMGAMKTTSSYGVTLESARLLRDMIPVGTGDSIDNLYGDFNSKGRCYITEPRFFVQYNNYSDLQKRQMNNTPCMEDGSHVTRLGNIGRKGAAISPPVRAPLIVAKPEVASPIAVSIPVPLSLTVLPPSWDGRPKRKF